MVGTPVAVVGTPAAVVAATGAAATAAAATGAVTTAATGVATATGATASGSASTSAGMAIRTMATVARTAAMTPTTTRLPPPVYVSPPPAAAPGYPVVGDAPPDNTAHVSVRIPADAEVWFGQGKTQQTGAVREFVSPPLTPGKEYTYDIKARWMVGGKEVVQTRQVDVAAGTFKAVDFTKPAAEGVEPPKAK